MATFCVSALATLFRQAEAAAIAADPGEGLHNDGGSCNFDTPAFRIKGAREADIQEAARLAEVPVSSFEWFGGRRWFWLNVSAKGQANRRSVMAGAADKVLREEGPRLVPGLEACFYQQSD